MLETGFCSSSQLSFVECGTGPRTVLLVHGIGSAKQIWRSTMLALSPFARVLAVDLPGHGSSPTLGAYSMREVAERLWAFCEAQQLGRFTLIGHSMGGNIALELFLAHSDTISPLVLADPAVHMANRKLYSFATRFVQWRQIWPVWRVGMVAVRLVAPVGLRVPVEHRGGMLLPMLRRLGYVLAHDDLAMFLQLDDLFANPLSHRLAELRLPVLVLTGKQDYLVPVYLTNAVSQAIGDAEYVVLDKAAHNPMDEDPDGFEQALLDFLRRRAEWAVAAG